MNEEKHYTLYLFEKYVNIILKHLDNIYNNILKIHCSNHQCREYKKIDSITNIIKRLNLYKNNMSIKIKNNIDSKLIIHLSKLHTINFIIKFPLVMYYDDLVLDFHDIYIPSILSLIWNEEDITYFNALYDKFFIKVSKFYCISFSDAIKISLVNLGNNNKIEIDCIIHYKNITIDNEKKCFIDEDLLDFIYSYSTNIKIHTINPIDLSIFKNLKQIEYISTENE